VRQQLGRWSHRPESRPQGLRIYYTDCLLDSRSGRPLKKASEACGVASGCCCCSCCCCCWCCCCCCWCDAGPTTTTGSESGRLLLSRQEYFFPLFGAGGAEGKEVIDASFPPPSRFRRRLEGLVDCEAAGRMRAAATTVNSPRGPINPGSQL
jgi:hypothetical protein